MAGLWVRHCSYPEREKGHALRPIVDSLRRYTRISWLWFAIDFSWQALTVVALPILVLEFVPEDSKIAALAFLMAGGAAIALFSHPLFGTMSDLWPTRLGRRTPFVLAGSLGMGIIVIFVFFSTSLTMLFAFVWLLFGVTALAQAPYEALIPDMVPADRRGEASGVMGLFAILGAIAGPLAAGLLMTNQRLTLVTMLTAVTLLCAALTYRFANEPRPQPVSFPGWSAIVRTARRLEVRRHNDFYTLLASRLFLLLAFVSVMTYLLYFIRDVLQVPQPERLAGIAISVATVSALLTVIPGGLLSDRLGRKPVLYVAGAAGISGLALLSFAGTTPQLLLAAIVIGLAFGIFSAGHWALTVDLAPPGQPAQFLGYAHITTAAAQLFGPALAGLIIELVDAATGSLALGYRAAYAAAGASILAGLIVLSRIPEPVSRVEATEGTLLPLLGGRDGSPESD